MKAGELSENPARRVDKPRIDRRGNVRFLDQAEESRLRSQGVPPNTVRHLLGHGSGQMSLRYAHLATDQRRQAVAKLNAKPILALTLLLQWQGP